MTQNKRIFWNIVATYGRSLYSLVIALCCCGWSYRILGEVDFGLMGLIAGLPQFFEFFNGLISSSLTRYFAFSVGQNEKSGGADLEEVRKWFNVALCVHTIIPTVLMVLGIPAGIWVVKCFLNIPADRVDDCLLCFYFSCVTSYLGMISIPFTAMYTAKQYIVELTFYSFFTSTLRVGYLYYMLTHPGKWLVWLVGIMCLTAVLTNSIILGRAWFLFPECKVNPKYLFDFSRMRQIVGFMFWKFFGNLGALVRGQGVNILVNKLFGPTYNAAVGVASQIASYSNMLAASMDGAFAPAITNLAGQGEHEKMMEMTYRMCRLGAFFCFVFAIPVAVEVENLLRLWLKTPPAFSAQLSYFVLGILIVGEMSKGIGIAVCAVGRVAKYHVVLGLMNVVSVGMAWVVADWLKCGFLSLYAVLLAAKILVVCSGALVAKKDIGFSSWRWMQTVILPMSILALCSYSAGCAFRTYIAISSPLLEVVIVGSMVEMVVVSGAWFAVLNNEERAIFVDKFKRILKR